MDFDLSEVILPSEFLQLIRDQKTLIDVRSEIEFSEGHIPGSINLPILKNPERILVGTAYKQQGPEAAIKLGHELVSGDTKKERVQAWVETIKNKNVFALTCFRGGLRSQLAQSWCKEAGISIPRIQGGTKALRTFFIEELFRRIQETPLVVISGATGAGKSLLLRDPCLQLPVLDLERIAHHRGSAFGSYPEPQPSQVLFENSLSSELIRLEDRLKINNFVLLEDESRLIGKLALPEQLFLKLRESKTIFVDEILETRTQNTFDDYILGSALKTGTREQGLAILDGYRQSLLNISKRLGGLRTQEALQDLAFSRNAFIEHNELESNKVWIQKILEWYYDPVYTKSIAQRSVRFAFTGTRSQVLEHLKSY